MCKDKKTTVCLIKDRPELQAIQAKQKVLADTATERRKWLHQQQETLFDETKKSSRLLWQEMADAGKSSGLLPRDLTLESYGISTEGGALSYWPLEDGGEEGVSPRGFLDFLKGLTQ